MSQDPINPTHQVGNQAPAGDGSSLGGTVEIFISYARKDRESCAVLLAHLAMLHREGLIKTWHDGMLLPGDDWNHVIYQKMQTAQIVLLLISKNFLASDFCYGIELKQAMERHARGETRIVPIILSPCDLQGVPFMKLQALPTNAEPITRWEEGDEAWADVATGLRSLVEVTRQTIDQHSATPKRTGNKRGDSDQINTVLSRYSRLTSWTSDLHDFFGAVIGAGGLRRVLRTFTTLTFNFEYFISFILSSADIEENRRRYLGPPVCMICMVAISVSAVFIMQHIAGTTSVLSQDIPILGICSIFGFGYFALMLRLLSTQKRPMGELLAVGCYLGGSIGIPSWIFFGILFILMLLAKLVLAFAELPIYTSTIAVASVAFIASIPLILARGLRRFVGKTSRSRILAFMMSVLLFGLLVLAVSQPGNAVMIGSLLCQGANRPACAEKLSKLSLRLQPQSESVWITRIGTLKIQGQVAEARQLAQQAIKLHPRSRTLHHFLGLLLFRDHPSMAENEFSLALEIDPGYSDAARELESLYLTQNKYPQLLEHCKMVLASDRFSEHVKRECDQGAGIALVNLERFNEAIDHLKRVLSTQIQAADLAGQARSLNLIGRTYSGLMDHRQALSYYEQALAVARQVDDRTSEGVALDNMGVVLARLGRPVDAITRYREEAATHLTRTPRDISEAMRSLDLAFKLSLRNKLWPQAKDVLSELLALDPSELQRTQWEAKLAWYTGAADAAARYAALARLAADLPATSRARTHAIATAGEQRARQRTHWPDCPGVVITEVRSGLLAATLGLVVGDIILRYQGQCIQENMGLMELTGKTQPSQSVMLNYWRLDRQHSLNASGGRLGIVTTSF